MLLQGSSKKPAATIPPNTTTGPVTPRPDGNTYGNMPYPNGPYGPSSNTYRPDQPTGPYPPYPNYPNSGYYPPNQAYNQNYNSSYYQQQQNPQQPYTNSYPNQYPQNNPECPQGYNQNYWGNSNYYGNSEYYNNPPYPNNQPPPEFRGNPSEFNNSQQYPQGYNSNPNEQPYPGNAIQPYPSNQEGYDNQPRPPYQNYPTQPGFPEFNSNPPPGQYTNNPPPQEYANQPYPPPYSGNQTSFTPNPDTYSQYDNQVPNYHGYSNNGPPNEVNENNMPNPVKAETNVPLNYPPDRKPDVSVDQPPTFNATGYNYTTNPPNYPEQSDNNSSGYPPYSGFPPHLKTESPLGSAGSGSPITSWPITELKTEVDKLKAEEKPEIKSESDGEVKIEDLDTKKIVKDESKKGLIKESPLTQEIKPEEIQNKENNTKSNNNKTDKSESEEEAPKRGRPRGKLKDGKKADKPKPRSKARAKGRKDRKTSKEKNDDSESEDSEKEEKVNREEELAMVKKAEEMTYDWAAELLKDYVPGIIENSAKMELLFYILNESIKMGDRLLLFSQSLFTLNLIEDFLERNYIPGTNCLWQRNTNYYRKFFYNNILCCN